MHWIPANLSGESQTHWITWLTGRSVTLKQELSYEMVKALRGLSERGRQAEEESEHGQTHGHSLGVALGRHRPLPSADWWEPTQSTNRFRDQPKEPVTSGLIKEWYITLCCSSTDTFTQNPGMWHLRSTINHYGLAFMCVCGCRDNQY